MKKQLFLLMMFMSFLTACGQINPANFPYGLRIPNATQVESVNIPLLNSSGVINTFMPFSTFIRADIPASGSNLTSVDALTLGGNTPTYYIDWNNFINTPPIPEVIDDDTFATATSTNVPSAESVKAYVDANAGGTLEIEDEGISTVPSATRLNFTGSAVTVTDAGSGEATINIVGGSGESTTVSDTAEIDLTLTGSDITGSIVAGSIDETKLDASVNASLDLADTALQSEVDGSITNEIQTLDVSQLSGTNLELSLSGDGEATKVIDLSSLQDGTGTDSQTLSFTSPNISISGGNSIDISAIDTNTTDHNLLSNIGTNSHAVIDSHIANGGVHYTQAAISITESQISDLGTYLTSEVDGSTTNELQNLQQVTDVGATTTANITTQAMTSTGTRAGSNLIVRLGDYDIAGNGTRIIINDENSGVYVYNNLATFGQVQLTERTLFSNEGLTYTVEIPKPVLTNNRIISLPDASGTFALTSQLATAGTDDQIASEVPFTPYSTIASTNVQTAIQELLDENGGGVGTLQNVIDSGDLAQSPNTSNYVLLDVDTNANTSSIDFGLDDTTANLSRFRQDIYGFDLNAQQYVSGARSQINMYEDFLRLRRSASTFDSNLLIGTPIADEVDFFLNTPSGTTANTDYYIPLSVNGTFADVNGNITIAGGGSESTTVSDTSEIDLTLTGSDITGSIVAGSIDETKLDASVNASLDLADSAVQNGDNQITLNTSADHANIYTQGATFMDYSTEFGGSEWTMLGGSLVATESSFVNFPNGVQTNDEVVYGVSWNGSQRLATRNTIYNKIETLDQSGTNELQTISNTSNATTHTATLSNSGGSLQLVEGSGITLTTSGTGLDGVITIASTGGGGGESTTVSDTAEIDLTLTGSDITASIVASSIDETKLDASVNASLDLADTALQSFTETDPVFSAHTTNNIVDGTGFLKNNGIGGWVYDSTVYASTSHVHTFASLTSKPTTIAGYGITDAYTKTEIDNLPKPTLSKGITIPDIIATDDATMFFTPVAITVSSVNSHITGATNVVFNINHASTRTGTGLDVFTSDITLTSTAGQTNNSGFNDATIPANSWVWLDVVSVSGTPTKFHTTLIYTED